jgi:ABC-type branched-subunit amino acid transport system ATPase component
MTTLELKGLSKSFDGIKAVDQISIGFEQGHVTGLIGPNGAGKTTLFNLISGFLKPDEGQVLFRDRNIAGLPTWKIARMGIGRLFQDVRVFAHMTAIDNVEVAFQQQIGEVPFCTLVAYPRSSREFRKCREKALELLAFVGLEDKANVFAEDLSYGQQKLLSVARLLAVDAQVLLLDEPTSGVSPKMAERLMELAGDLAKSGRTVVFIEHNMNVVIQIADWVYFLSNGQMTFFGPPADVLGNPDVRKEYIGV